MKPKYPWNEFKKLEPAANKSYTGWAPQNAITEPGKDKLKTVGLGGAGIKNGASGLTNYNL